MAPFNTSAQIGQNATIACLVSNKGSSETVKWYLEGQSSALTTDSLFLNDHYQPSGQYNLTIVSVTLNDQAQYTCEAGSNSLSASLTVVDLPSNLSVYWSTSPVAGTTANITCYASRGHPPPTLSWFKNNNELDSSNAAYTGNTDSSGYGVAYSTLPVSLSSGDQGAEFRCEASYPDWNAALSHTLVTQLSGSERPVLCSLLPALASVLLLMLR
nr:hypothetical protein BaRGS_023377 [Batillaria attramentaria]